MHDISINLCLEIEYRIKNEKTASWLFQHTFSVLCVHACTWSVYRNNIEAGWRWHIRGCSMLCMDGGDELERTKLGKLVPYVAKTLSGNKFLASPRHPRIFSNISNFSPACPKYLLCTWWTYDWRSVCSWSWRPSTQPQRTFENFGITDVLGLPSTVNVG